VIWKLTFIHDQIHAVSADQPRDSAQRNPRHRCWPQRAVGSPQSTS